MDLLDAIDGTITIDETGVETGHFGRIFLKSAFQTIFEREGRNLAPFAVEGLVAPFDDDGALSPDRLFAAAKAADAERAVQTMCRTLHIRNFAVLDAPWLRLFLNFDPNVPFGDNPADREIAVLREELDAIGLDPRKLVCEITETEADRIGLVAFAGAMRRIGAMVAIDDFGAGHSTLSRIQLVRPDIVKLDRGMIGRLAGVAGAARLLASLVAGLHELGARVLAEGVETPGHLELALDAGVDYVQGFLLSEPALAGTDMRMEPLEIASLLKPARNVIPLRGTA